MTTHTPPIAKDIMNKWWIKSEDGKLLKDTKISQCREQELQKNMFNCSLELLTLYFRSMYPAAKIRSKWTRNNIENQLRGMK